MNGRYEEGSGIVGEQREKERADEAVLSHSCVPIYTLFALSDPKKNVTPLGLTVCWKKQQRSFRRPMSADSERVKERVTKVLQIRGGKDRNYHFKSSAVRVWWMHARPRLMWAWLSVSNFRTSHDSGLAGWVARARSLLILRIQVNIDGQSIFDNNVCMLTHILMPYTACNTLLRTIIFSLLAWHAPRPTERNPIFWILGQCDCNAQST